ncbi:TetR family transcriptional regulator [Frondihabitans sp. PAMC 28766]|uniref:TetR family transcriptional regulator n=1 Tax=Frondihabitans sp. PAMC 28766 TaxID=1795630 RepID=UPI00078B9098|nr:TetR family transcriptional regulator [Frondihabitans sp. PAMC 28766]AMM22483.1 TetR family transcriptional regulator [Frondihabitans sp. PAMC 28766]
MVRWEPGASDRLRKAALELYAARGFEQTTAAEIAASVGLTERTFFRHFADKREVIFNGAAEFEGGFIEGVRDAPESESVLEVVSAALAMAARFFPDERREFSRLRQTIIDDNASLREREQLKMTTLATGIAEALRDRGVTEPHASLAAQSGVTVFTVSFHQWIAEGETRPLGEIEADIMGELRSLTRAPLPNRGDSSR